MNILVRTILKSNQAKLLIKKGGGTALIKIPFHLSQDKQAEIRGKFLKIVDIHKDSPYPLKMYYRIDAPYMFLHRKLSSKNKSTTAVYTYADL